MVNKNKVSKKMFAILLAIILVLTTFPIGFASVFAASKNEFSVEIKDYSFSAKVTLTDETDPENTQTETATNGKALFSDFVDDTKKYNLQITDLVGYEDYSYSGLVVEGDSIEVLKTDLTEIEKAIASGIVKDENDAPVSGAVVSYSAYNGNVTGEVTTNVSGEYSFNFYKGIDYSITITGDEKYEVKPYTLNANADKDLGTHKLKVKQFGIAITVGTNGSASQSNVMVDYGEDCPSIEINANQNYLIDSLTIDGSVVSEAVGKQSFDISSLLKNITDNHTVNATFILDEIEVIFNISRTGKIEIEDGSSISTAGTVTISNGNDETPVNESKKLLAGQSVSIKVNGADILMDSDNVSIDETFYTRDTITNDLTFRVNTNLATRAEDGSYKIEVVVIDNAGNVSETYTKTIYKDIDAPSVTNFEFEAKGYDKDEAIDSKNTAPVQEMPYGFYFIEDTKVTVTAEDIVPTSGVKSITYYTVDKDGGTSAENTVLVNLSNKISFEVPANFKGQIYAKATDNVDNVTSEFVNPNGVVVENEEQHKKTSHIIYTLQESKDANGNDVKDSEGNNLYGANTTVDVEIADTYSGIRQIDWEIITPFDDKKQAGTVTVDNNGKVTSVAKDGYSDDCLAEWKATTEDNLVTVLKNTISVTNNSNDIEIHFTLTDRAGNVTKDVVQKLSIDKSSPLIAIQMNENDDDTYSGFFQGKREATVYVYERNFASSDFTFDVKRTDDNNNETNVSPTSKFEKVGVQVVDGVECYVYKMNTTFTDDGDYNFTVSAQDTASHINNSAAASHKVNDAVVKYSSNKTDEYIAQNDEDRSIDNAFTIDNTKPVVSVSYDNNDVRNDKYFNSNRTATITVNEHNFTSTNNRITYTRTSTKDGSAISEPEISNWSQNGNTYTATINYNSDGDYTFAMEVVDKAGNGIKDSDVSYSGKAPKDFVVDTTIDKPIITGVENGSSYKDSVLPKIDFSDINFKDHKIVLTRTRKDEIDKDVTADFIKLLTNNKGGSFAANEETFKKIQENDGIYTLSVEITDKAENTSSEQVIFTVNRFGSVYSLGSFLTSDLNNKYVQSVNDDIVITEYNPDRIVKGSLDVVVTRDGSPVEYKDGDLKISPVVNELAQIGNSGWYQYEYTISKNVFLDTNGNPADGIYKVYVGSEDTVGNKSENISYEDCEVMFRLDHTPPTIKSVSGLENKIVNADELNVSYEIFDAIGISEIILEYYGKDNQMTTDRIAADGEDKENLVDVLSDLLKATTIGITGREASGKTNFVRLIMNYCQQNVFDYPVKAYLVDSYEKDLDEFSSGGFVEQYTINSGEVENIFESIESELIQRKKDVQEFGIEFIKNEPLLLCVIDNNNIYESNGISKQAVDIYKRIITNYKAFKVLFIFSNIPNSIVSYSSPEMLKQVKDINYIYCFDDLVNSKLFDINVTISRKFKKPIELGDAYRITPDNSVIKLKTIKS